MISENNPEMKTTWKQKKPKNSRNLTNTDSLNKENNAKVRMTFIIQKMIQWFIVYLDVRLNARQNVHLVHPFHLVHLVYLVCLLDKVHLFKVLNYSAQIWAWTSSSSACFLYPWPILLNMNYFEKMHSRTCLQLVRIRVVTSKQNMQHQTVLEKGDAEEHGDNNQASTYTLH